MIERISKGIEIKSDAKIQKLGGSWCIILPPDLIMSMEITEITPCKIFRNQNNQVIIEIEERVDAKNL